MINIPQLTQVDYKESAPTVWYGCYDGGWKDITPESFQHPAKFAQNLCRRIIEYGLEKGYIKAGDVILDVFGGVGLGAKYALANGLSWVGCELEKKFTDLGQGCDCTGISKADWVRFYGRWEKANYKDGRHWCPECLAEARKINPPAPRSFTLSLFDDEPTPSAAYIRNSGIIPETKPHHYTGNLELFKRYARPGTFAVLLNGDSRNLRAVIGQGVAEGLLSSPPYANAIEKRNKATTEGDRRHRERIGRNPDSGGSLPMREYGRSEGQLGAMPAGSLADSLLSSPPYGDITNVGERRDPNKAIAAEKRYRENHPELAKTRPKPIEPYGDTPGQLGAMPTSGFDSLLSSPPFAGNTGGRGEASRNGIDAALFDRHSGGMKKGTGDDPGNLDHLPMRGFDAALASPPYGGIEMTGGAGGIGVGSRHLSGASKEVAASGLNYGKSNGQLGSMSGGFDASLASPPFEGSLNDGLSESDRQKYKELTRCGRGVGTNYGTTAGQLGTEQGGTFWEAARQIVSEAYLALKPGGYTFWVTKRFVRDGAIVDFTGQWRQLCEACGFEFVEHIQAMLIQSESEQGNLNGDVIKTKKKKASFFRRLHEKKFPHLAIDHEDVLVLRKPEALP